jgi:hypothetical protein
VSHPIIFEKQTTYKTQEIGITIDATLRHGNREIVCSAKVDTGSKNCLFEREIADRLEIDLESGYREKFSTLGGRIFAYGHFIELETLGLRFESFVYFAESYAVNRNLLGREGWLQLVKLGVVDYENRLFLSPYSE